jgi:hypothetical protein
MSRELRDLKSDWRRWSALERVTAVSLLLIGSFASALLTIAGTAP